MDAFRASVESIRLTNQASDTVVDGLVDDLLAYDRVGVLSRDWIEHHLTAKQLKTVVERIVAAHAGSASV